MPTKALSDLSPALQHGIKLILHERNVAKYENAEQYERRSIQYVPSDAKNNDNGTVQEIFRDDYDHYGKYENSSSDTTYTEFSTSNYGNEIENEIMNENDNMNENAWAEFFDESAQANYWFNDVTGEASWINPNS